MQPPYYPTAYTVDHLISLSVDVRQVCARARLQREADAGEHVEDGRDLKQAYLSRVW